MNDFVYDGTNIGQLFALLLGNAAFTGAVITLVLVGVVALWRFLR